MSINITCDIVLLQTDPATCGTVNSSCYPPDLCKIKKSQTLLHLTILRSVDKKVKHYYIWPFEGEKTGCHLYLLSCQKMQIKDVCLQCKYIPILYIIQKMCIFKFLIYLRLDVTVMVKRNRADTIWMSTVLQAYINPWQFNRPSIY